MASRWFRRPLSESLRDWGRRLVSTLPSGLLFWRFNAARSRLALNRSSFSWLVSRARLAAARSRSALKRSSVSLELSLDSLTAARLRWASRRSSLCSPDSLDRSETAHFRLAVRRSSLCSLDRLTATPWRFLSSLPFVACPSRWSFKTFSLSLPNSRDPLSDIFSSNTSCSLSFDICLNVDLTKSDDFSRHFCALTQKSRQMPHPDDVTTPCHKQTPRELSAPRHHAPHQSLSIPMTSRLSATNKLRESSALPAMRGPVFRIFPL